VDRTRLVRAADPAARVEVLPGQVHGTARRAGARGNRQAAGRREARDHPGHLAHRLGRPARPPGAAPAPGAQRAGGDQPSLHGGVPAAGRGRGHRAVELPGVHAGGLDRLRAGGRERGGVQAFGADPGDRELAGPVVCRGAGGVRRDGAGVSGRDRARVDGRGAGAQRRQQDRVHRVRGHRAEGHGGRRRHPDPGPGRVRRQGRAAGQRGRRPRRGRRRRGVGRDVQRGPDVRRDRAGLRSRRGVPLVLGAADFAGVGVAAGV
jgi:hypothetical protein